MAGAGSLGYSPEQEAFIARLEHDLEERMAAAKPRRFEHSLSVARTAQSMALSFGVDPFDARCAGILHDWDKLLDAEEQLAKARMLGIDLGVDLALVVGLLHGPTAARTLPELYPELSKDVLQAIARHTLGAPNMQPLDKIIFVADGIEPLRPDSPGIERVRALLSAGESLDKLYWESFTGGVEYVVRTRRYLYPGAIELYNSLVLEGVRD